MSPTSRFTFLLLIVALAATSASAQVATGTSPFGSFGGGPDVINLANLNAHITVPVLHKPGRGTNFTYDLSYDSSVWYPVTSGSTTTWQPVYNWGWRANTEVATGYLSYSVISQRESCFDSYLKRTIYYYINIGQSYAYHDAWGVRHPFLGTSSDGGSTSDGACTTDPWSMTGGLATDGSGYSLTTSGTTFQSLYSGTGTNINPPLNTGTGSGSFTDRNGNFLSVSSGGAFTDTLGTTALTVAGTAPSNTTFTYTPPAGGSVAYTMKYTTFSIQTNFGCSSVTDYGTNGTMTANLVSEIDLPDGSKYAFSYEPTPGHSGFVTGRLASVTLPTGGHRTYTYTGGNNGINCADGSAATLTRTTPDGTQTHAQLKRSGSTSTTTTTHPPAPPHLPL